MKKKGHNNAFEMNEVDIREGLEAHKNNFEHTPWITWWVN
jgi:hypothetical protein